MKKTNAMLYLDGKIYEAMLKKFPKKVSQITENYWKGLLDMEKPFYENTTIEELQGKINAKEDKIMKLKQELSLLNNHKIVQENNIQKESGERIRKAEAMSKGLKASGVLARMND